MEGPHFRIKTFDRERYTGLTSDKIRVHNSTNSDAISTFKDTISFINPEPRRLFQFERRVGCMNGDIDTRNPINFSNLKFLDSILNKFAYPLPYFALQKDGIYVMDP